MDTPICTGLYGNSAKNWNMIKEKGKGLNLFNLPGCLRLNLSDFVEVCA